MNEIFKKMKSERIKLDEQYYLLPDGFKGIVLQKEYEKLGKDKDGNPKTFFKKETFYYPNISKTLMKYLNLKCCEAKSIEELKDILIRIEGTINSIKESWND